MLVMGVDGARLSRRRTGWVGVALQDGRYSDAAFGESLEALAERFGELDTIAVDMPVGWVDGIREADGLVRQLLPRRAAAVFNAPPAAIRGAASYGEACALARAATGQAISQQSWALVQKIEDVTRFARSTHSRVVEAHPELSFASLRGGDPVPGTKKVWGGVMERMDLLVAAGIAVPADLGEAAQAAPDDVLDAAVVAWTAQRVAAGQAGCLPDPPEDGLDGAQVAVWY